MSGRHIDISVERRLYAESLGRCMNPKCRKSFFSENGDIIERAHIDPYCKTADNSFENLILLCPNCHTDFDKNHAFTPEEVLNWKKIRREEVEKIFGVRYSSFEELKKVVSPLLLENQTIFSQYFMTENKILWDKFETLILVNNRKLKSLLLANINLFQSNKQKAYSNLEYIYKYIRHIDEFEATRENDEKIREVLFPKEVDSMFGIAPVEDTILPFTETLEQLIEKLKACGKFRILEIGVDHPYIQIWDNGKKDNVYLDDAPRLRQLYYDYKCFRSMNVRLDSLNFALKYLRNRGIRYKFQNEDSLREIVIDNEKLIFVYEYCLSQAFLIRLAPSENSVIINLHNWNGEKCISSQAYQVAADMGVQLLTLQEFYKYVNKFK